MAASKIPEDPPEVAAVDLDGLHGASSAELALLAQQLGAEVDELDTGLRAQVVTAFGRLSMKELSRRLTEAQVDASMCKERKSLESLLAQAMLARQRAAPAAIGSRQTSSEPPLQRSTSPPRCRGVSVPPAGVTVAPPIVAASSSSCRSQLVATGLSGASVLHQPHLEVGELEIGSGPFDPTEPTLQATIRSLLGYSQTSRIEEMTGFRGGLNEGVWFLSDREQSPPARDLVLKLVKCKRISEPILTEAENLVKMYRVNPKIATDPTMAFPVRILKCLGPAPERAHRYDLIVMWKVQGERLSELIAHKWYQKSFDDLWAIFERLGQTLAAFHLRYNESQHGDFQPSNVFFDEETGELFLIDIGGMGVATSESDTEHFCKSLKLLADVYGSQLMLTGQRCFENGYAAGVRTRSK
jgi:hypothetical protein